MTGRRRDSQGWKHLAHIELYYCEGWWGRVCEVLWVCDLDKTKQVQWAKGPNQEPQGSCLPAFPTPGCLSSGSTRPLPSVEQVEPSSPVERCSQCRVEYGDSGPHRAVYNSNSTPNLAVCLGQVTDLMASVFLSSKWVDNNSPYSG